MSYLLTLWNLHEQNKQFVLTETTVDTAHECVMRNPRTHVANQDDKHRLEDLCTNLSRNGVGEVSKRSKKFISCKYRGARREREPSRIQCKKIIKLFKKSKSSRKCIKCYIMFNTPLSSTMKDFLSIDFRINLTSRLCRGGPSEKNSILASIHATNNIFSVKKRTNKHKNTQVLLCVNNNCNLNICSIKSNKQQQKYCVSRTKLFASGDIELNPGPVNNHMLLQYRLSQQGLSILDVGGAGDCFF